MSMPNYKYLADQINIYEDLFNDKIISNFNDLLDLKLLATNKDIFTEFQLNELKKLKLFNDLCAYNLYNIILNASQNNNFDIIQNDNKLGIRNNKIKICNFVYNFESKIDIFYSPEYIDFMLKILNLDLNNDFKEEKEFDNRISEAQKVKKLIHPCNAIITIR